MRFWCPGCTPLRVSPGRCTGQGSGNGQAPFFWEPQLSLKAALMSPPSRPSSTPADPTGRPRSPGTTMGAGEASSESAPRAPAPRSLPGQGDSLTYSPWDRPRNVPQNTEPLLRHPRGQVGLGRVNEGTAGWGGEAQGPGPREDCRAPSRSPPPGFSAPGAPCPALRLCRRTERVLKTQS